MIFKSKQKDIECNMNNYPAQVKCYEYDTQGRVTKLNISSSGTQKSFNYKYNDKNEIVAINDGNDNYFISYNSDGSIAELKRHKYILIKKLVFICN